MSATMMLVNKIAYHTTLRSSPLQQINSNAICRLCNCNRFKEMIKDQLEIVNVTYSSI